MDGETNTLAARGLEEPQFVVERKFICDSHNTCLKLNIRVKIKLSITVYIFFALYGSTALQSLVNNDNLSVLMNR
jgi:hypothetical protein